ncbi:flagellar export protein FliJ [Uliginosibacterium paludis]|uniref:Flagellar FliJ protein n=1 Tax=Uliginosibacterium paludis TaxID=1615952 RepID=A0ABV2CL18_9RHOO
MVQKSPLHTLQELAHTRVDEATRRLGELMAGEQAAEVKLKLLQDYRKEYSSRFMENARNGIDPNAWRNYSNFLAKLDEAIGAQQFMLERSRQATAQGQQSWVAENTRAKAFDTLNERQEKLAAARHEKFEQRQTDEHAMKNFRNQHEGEE